MLFSLQCSASIPGHTVFSIHALPGLLLQKEGVAAAAVFTTNRKSCSNRAVLSQGDRRSYFRVLLAPVREEGIMSQISERSSMIAEPSLPVAPVSSTRCFFKYPVFHRERRQRSRFPVPLSLHSVLPVPEASVLCPSVRSVPLQFPLPPLCGQVS